jgi:hypothetical protein
VGVDLDLTKVTEATMGYLLRVFSFFIAIAIGFSAMYLLFQIFKSSLVPFFGFALVVILDNYFLNRFSKYVAFSGGFELRFFGHQVFSFRTERIEYIRLASPLSIPISIRLVRFGIGLTNVVIAVKSGFIFVLPLANFRSIQSQIAWNPQDSTGSPVP